VARRKTFDPDGVPLPFSRRDDVRLALARREVGNLFAIYLDTYADCTQTQLALLTEHHRSDISNFVRGTRGPRVTDIGVLGRVADGLVMPDEARILFGLAPADVTLSLITSEHTSTDVRPSDSEPGRTTGWFRPHSSEEPLRIALCGSRSATTDPVMTDQAVAAVSRRP
jgi:hypothetical protein